MFDKKENGINCPVPENFRELGLRYENLPCGVFPVIYDKKSGEALWGQQRIIIDKSCDSLTSITMTFILNEKNIDGVKECKSSE